MLSDFWWFLLVSMFSDVVYLSQLVYTWDRSQSLGLKQKHKTREDLVHAFLPDPTSRFFSLLVLHNVPGIQLYLDLEMHL